MSIFNELILPKIFEIEEESVKCFETAVQAALDCLDKFQEEYFSKILQDKAQRDKTHISTLQSINEDDSDTNKTPEIETTETDRTDNNSGKGITDSNDGKYGKSKKRSKDEVEDMVSPQPDKRLKRNASAKAQSNITKQMTMNLTQKLRREDLDSSTPIHNHVNKENADPIINIQIKQEKISLPEAMDVENVSVKQEMSKDQEAMPPPAVPMPKSRNAVQKQKSQDSSEEESGSGSQRSTMTKNLTHSGPPPEPRKAVQKDKSEDRSEEEAGTRRQRSTRTRKETDSMPPPPVPSARPVRAVRASARATRTLDSEEDVPPPETRPKRTRAKKKESEALSVEVEKDKRLSQENEEVPLAQFSRSTKQQEMEPKQSAAEDMPPPETRPKRTRAKKKVSDGNSEPEKDAQSDAGSPTEKPRPKRTRRGQKAAEKESQNPMRELQTPEEPLENSQKELEKVIELILPKQERISEPEFSSPVLQQKSHTKKLQKQDSIEQKTTNETRKLQKQNSDDQKTTNETKKLQKQNSDEQKTTKETKKLQKQDSGEQKTTKETKKLHKQDSDEQNTTKETKKLQKQNSDEKTSKTKTTKSRKDEIAKQNSAEIEDTISQNVDLNEANDEMKQKKDKNNALKPKFDETVTLSHMDKTVILSNGDDTHAPGKSKKDCNVNETVVVDPCNQDTFIMEKHAIMDCTVVLEKGLKIANHTANLTDDNSILTDDNSEIDQTPPRTTPPEPTSAVKAKVQQFEELAARTTRTKTRAMAKIDDPDKHTPPDKILKPVLSAESLNKMNNMIFNGKAPQVSNSASKPRSHLPLPKANHASTTSKLSSISRHREAAEETLKREKEDARKKKEAILEAKREQQKRKREDKMAAAAAAREAAERERKLAMEAAAKERMEKQAHADQGKMERLKEAERKRLELARKAAETEERRKAEVQARQLKLVEEQKRAEELRRKQIEEAEVSRKEAALMAKEIEKKQKEYMQKQKMKVMENGKTHAARGALTPGTPARCQLEPAYMQDGYQHVYMQEDEEGAPFPVAAWSSSKARKLKMTRQALMEVERQYELFSSRVFCPDLRDIFANVERRQLKRTSSAVWRTPPRLPTLQE